MQQPLVSIITPCYNGQSTISRLIDSVLAQSYPNIEFIVVNDGSIDQTEEVIARYTQALKENLTSFTYLRQENQGLGGALNTGLRHVNGRYLCWPDADDYLEPESVARRVSILESDPEYAVVTSDAYVRPADDIAKILGKISTGFRHNRDAWQFDHLLRAESIFTSGTHMVCMRRFDQTHPGRKIYPARRGQNWQMLLPLYYRFKRYFLDEPLYNYIVTPGSMSRTDSSSATALVRASEHRDIIRHTLAAMDMTDADRAASDIVVEESYARALMRAGILYGDFDVALDGYRILAALGRQSPRDLIRVSIARTAGTDPNPSRAWNLFNRIYRRAK